MRYLMIFALLVPGMAISEVYKCSDGVYQADPCGDATEALDLSHVGSTVENSHKVDKKNIQSYINNQQVERDISSLERQRKKALDQRDRRLSELKNSRRWAMNNLAGATWQQSLAQEMSAVSQQAETLVSTIDRQIAQLRTEFR
ncbi:hypothetical protein Sps_05117 [Shewanella psychrophila]|uniref:DUF4124 domain-containing protein n=1 Tax=Shewanella psychrophila TaxID=225848 RepID=A0A1S6HX84_9GAMM|nr:hypothetical protein [Shewanella psychrophila]AQS40186.1 hypothetical protein Sps_05117 [Shewanella psychrophila]